MISLLGSGLARGSAPDRYESAAERLFWYGLGRAVGVRPGDRLTVENRQQDLAEQNPPLRLTGTESQRAEKAREEELLQAALSGDNNARDLLLDGYQKRLYTICYRMLGNHEDARDLTQDALVRIITHFQTYDGRAAFSTWAIRIAMNACLSHLRKQKHRRHIALDQIREKGVGTEQESSSFREPEPGESVEREQMRNLLQWALVQIDPELRSVLVLRDIRGLDYQSIAEIEEIAIGTVKSRLFRARLAMREVLSTVQKQADESFGNGDSREPAESRRKRGQHRS